MCFIYMILNGKNFIKNYVSYSHRLQSKDKPNSLYITPYDHDKHVEMQPTSRQNT